MIVVILYLVEYHNVNPPDSQSCDQPLFITRYNDFIFNFNSDKALGASSHQKGDSTTPSAPNAFTMRSR